MKVYLGVIVAILLAVSPLAGCTAPPTTAPLTTTAVAAPQTTSPTPAAPGSGPSVAPSSDLPTGGGNETQQGPQEGTGGNTTPSPASQLPIPPGVTLNPAAVPLLQEMAAGKSYVLIPLNYVTGPDWQSYDTWPLYYFEYRGDGYHLWIPYNTAAYESAKNGYPSRAEDRNRDTQTLLIVAPNFGYFVLPTPPQVAWYKGLIADPAQNETYDAILSQMRLIRERYQLDDNEYAELIARFVQRSVPNLDQGKIERYPIETIGDLGGGRVDKSLLLAGLLSREGYAVSLIYFPNVNVIFVGIAGDHKAPEYEGYLAIDPATVTFVGLDVQKAARKIPGIAPFMADYTVTKVSDGKGFTAGGQLRGIWDSWFLFENADDPRTYAYHLSFMNKNIDDRKLVAGYLAQVGIFRSSRTTG